MNNASACLNESSGLTVGENVMRCTMFNKGIARARVFNDGKLILQKSSEGLSFRSDGQNQIVSAGRCEKWGSSLVRHCRVGIANFAFNAHRPHAITVGGGEQMGILNCERLCILNKRNELGNLCPNRNLPIK